MDSLTEEVKTFIRQNENADVNQLLLKHKVIAGYPASFVADQIAARKKAKYKLPLFYNDENVIFPPAINLEQSSSEQTAKYKAQFIRNEVSQRTSACDLTMGFGIDSFFLSHIFAQFTSVEPNDSLLEIARFNHHRLGANNINYKHSTAEAFVSGNNAFDLVYIDPSRRTATKQKVFSLSECEPDITILQHDIFQKSNHLMVKTSPLLDIQLGLKELSFVKKVIVLSVNNECKEVLFFCEKNYALEPEIIAVNLEKENQDTFAFKLTDEKASSSIFSETKKYIYEPNASILKTGAFKLAGSNFGLNKLHQHTHLYTSNELDLKFPGRIFQVTAVVKPEPKSVAEFIPEGQANITTRNYPLSVDELRKKTRLKEGGTKFLIGFTDIKQKSVVVAERIA